MPRFHPPHLPNNLRPITNPHGGVAINITRANVTDHTVKPVRLSNLNHLLKLSIVACGKRHVNDGTVVASVVVHEPCEGVFAADSIVGSR